MNTLLKSNQVGRGYPLGRSASVLGRSSVRVKGDVNCSDASDISISLRPGTSALRGWSFQMRSNSAFTMVEIALALAIIGFALVAIIGVLPFGLNVQRQNREETIITQESGYFMDALRNGRRGLEELTNRVISITNYWTRWDTNAFPWTVDGAGNDGYTLLGSRVTSTNSVADNTFNLIDGYRIISLLGRPKFEYIGGTILRSNHVVALVRAIAGSATEKNPQQDTNVLNLGFNYRMLAEVHDVPSPSQVSGIALGQTQSLQTNLHEVRLKFSWPLFPGNRLGNERLTFRSMVSGRHEVFEEPQRYPPNPVSNHPIFFFNPTVF